MKKNKGDFFLDEDTYITGTRQIINKIHDKSVCEGGPCPIHNPSDHPMKKFPTNWRDDRRIMERICEHGVGHPDPDDIRIRLGDDKGIHGCDGCCRGSYPSEAEAAKKRITSRTVTMTRKEYDALPDKDFAMTEVGQQKRVNADGKFAVDDLRPIMQVTAVEERDGMPHITMGLYLVVIIKETDDGKA